MNTRRQPHQSRRVKGRSFAIHTRWAAPRIERMNEWITSQQRISRDILNPETKGRAFQRRLGANAVGKGIYFPESPRWGGLEAYAREKIAFMKHFGLVRRDEVLTSRMDEYLKNLEEGGTGIELLRGFSLGIKLKCPQLRSYLYRRGQQQASYQHYRIRPIILTLYAIHTGQCLEIEVNTDDLVLTVLRFIPPFVHSPITETWMRTHIDSYFQDKSRMGKNYLSEYRGLADDVAAEIGRASLSNLEFKRKCRNAANNAWCLIILMSNLELIHANKKQPSHWSATQQSYNRTPRTDYHELSLADIGNELKATHLNMVPVWHDDISGALPNEEQNKELLRIITDIGERGFTDIDNYSEHLQSALNSLGIELVHESMNRYRPRVPVIFNREYDIP